MTTSIFIRIDVPDFVKQPGRPIAQTLREITPYIETANPLASGYYPDRLTGQTRAEWTVEVNATQEGTKAA